MKFNTRIRYGIRAMVDIALGVTGSGVLQKDISIRQKISVKYLDSIIASLKKAGLITTIRGKKSGYMITRQPGQIKIIDIYKAFEPEVEIVDCMSCGYVCGLSDSCSTKEFWEILNKTVITHFESYTLEDLIVKQKQKSRLKTIENK